MKKEDTYAFLIRAAIPEITEKKKLPEDLRWKKDKGKKEEIEKEKEYKSNKLIWECIYRAHRDVLSGRDNVRDYSKIIDKDTGLNSFALELYGIITSPEREVPMSSDALINKLLDFNGRIGSVQKLVNMTLKYMFILQLYGILEGYDIEETNCHCPLDSRILESLGMSDFKWTSDFKTKDCDDGYAKYKEIQKSFKEKSGLAYDFEMWQHI